MTTRGNMFLSKGKFAGKLWAKLNLHEGLVSNRLCPLDVLNILYCHQSVPCALVTMSCCQVKGLVEVGVCVGVGVGVW